MKESSFTRWELTATARGCKLYEQVQRNYWIKFHNGYGKGDLDIPIKIMLECWKTTRRLQKAARFCAPHTGSPIVSQRLSWMDLHMKLGKNFTADARLANGINPRFA